MVNVTMTHFYSVKRMIGDQINFNNSLVLLCLCVRVRVRVIKSEYRIINELILR